MAMNRAKNNMITQQLRAGGVLDDTILNYFAELNREDFVPADIRDLAYADMQLPLPNEQLILAPKEQGIIIQSLEIKKSDNILEIGTGYGYMTALLAKCSKNLTSVDIFPEFTQIAAKNLKNVGISHVNLVTEDASTSDCSIFSQNYDIIMITGALALEGTKEMYAQYLKPNGRLFTIVGQAPTMQASISTSTNANSLKDNIIFETMVPFLVNTAPKPAFEF